jgi:DNA invertase Pin-like site-specific DNA recombinase
MTLPDALAHPKIRGTHLERPAYIYVRQSSPKQVAQNLESQYLQYQLAQRAETLGWHPEQVRIMDDDQGISAKNSAGRSGYQELVAEVSLGRVGIIFGWQVSRIARNNADWYHLLDLAALVDTLIADVDGVYDLRNYNDRLLLGLKGTMSEAELHWLHQRLDEGRLSQVRRGEYRQHLPTGLVRLENGVVVKDPDDQVRHAIELILLKFEELGSCGKVLRYFRRENILIPRRQRAGLFKGQLLWKPPTDSAIYETMRNPAYAGAFAYGRKQVDYVQQTPGRPATGRLARPMSEWLHLHQDVYPAYITWDQYLANQARLQQNSTLFRENAARAQGAPREGAALLQGLMVCGTCGCVMSVGYKRTPHYQCEALVKRAGEKSCLWLPGPPIEAVVVQAFFEALRPAQIDALAAILADQKAERQRLAQQWDERLKRAQYDVHLAERQYNAVDPDNRLVAAELERRWEVALRQLHDTQAAYDHFHETPPPSDLSPDLREKLTHLSETLPDVWPTLPYGQQKELLRCLIAQVICTKVAPDHVEVRIVWVSGHYSVVYAQPAISRLQDLADYEAMVRRIETLWREGLNNDQIAAQLTAEGFHSARRPDVPAITVQTIRLEHGWYLMLARSQNALELDGFLTVRGLAQQLGLDRSTVYRLIYDGRVEPRYVTRDPQSNVYLIQNDPQMIERLRNRPSANHLR